MNVLMSHQRHNLKILNAVIEFIAVLVVYLFSSQKWSPKMSTHYLAMGEHSSVSIGSAPIAARPNPPFAGGMAGFIIWVAMSPPALIVHIAPRSLEQWSSAMWNRASTHGRISTTRNGC